MNLQNRYHVDKAKCEIGKKTRQNQTDHRLRVISQVHHNSFALWHDHCTVESAGFRHAPAFSVVGPARGEIGRGHSSNAQLKVDHASSNSNRTNRTKYAGRTGGQPTRASNFATDDYGLCSTADCGVDIVFRVWPHHPNRTCNVETPNPFIGLIWQPLSHIECQYRRSFRR